MKKYEDNPEVIIDTLVAEVISELSIKHMAECLDLKARYKLKYFFSGLIEELPDTGSYRYSNLGQSIVLKTPDKRTFLLRPFILIRTSVSTDSSKAKLSYKLEELLPMEDKQSMDLFTLLSNNTDFTKKYYLKSEEVRVKEEELEGLTDDLDLLKTEALKLILEKVSFDLIEIQFNPLINVGEVFEDIRPSHLDEEVFILNLEHNSVIFPGSLKIDTRVETHKQVFPNTLTVDVTEFKFGIDKEPFNVVMESGYIDSVTFINDYFSITLDEILTELVQTQ